MASKPRRGPDSGGREPQARLQPGGTSPPPEASGDGGLRGRAPTASPQDAPPASPTTAGLLHSSSHAVLGPEREVPTRPSAPDDLGLPGPEAEGPGAPDSPTCGGQSPPRFLIQQVPKQVLLSIVHDKSDKWDGFIQHMSTNALRQCVQILFNSSFGKALGQAGPVPVPYKKLARHPEAVEAVGIPDGIPFKRPCAYGASKLRRILEERHSIRLVLKGVSSEQAGSDEVGVSGDWGPGTSGPLGPRRSEPEDPNITRVTVSSCVAALEGSGVEGAAAQEPGEDPWPETWPAEHSRGHTASLLREQVATLFNTRYAEALGVQVPVQVPYSTFLTHPEELCVLGLPDGLSLGQPDSFGIAELCQILQASDGIRFVIRRPELLPAGTMRPVADSQEVGWGAPLVADGPTYCDARVPWADMSQMLRMQVQHLFSERFAEAVGASSPVQVPYGRIQNDPGWVTVEGLPPGVPFCDPRTASTHTLERILAVADEVRFRVARPLAERSPRPAEPEDNALGRMVVLRERVRALFSQKYGEALGWSHPVPVPYRQVQERPFALEVTGLPADVPFQNPRIYSAQQLEKILEAQEHVHMVILSVPPPCTQMPGCQPGTRRSPAQGDVGL